MGKDEHTCQFIHVQNHVYTNKSRHTKAGNNVESIKYKLYKEKKSRVKCNIFSEIMIAV